jgi:hypothetical protein
METPVAATTTESRSYPMRLYQVGMIVAVGCGAEICAFCPGLDPTLAFYFINTLERFYHDHKG